MWISLGVIASAGIGLAAWLTVLRPRLGLYTLLALSPTQFIFVPVGDFFISPADVLALGAAVGVLLRLASGSSRARAAIHLHVMLGLMIAAYLVGFVVLDYSSRTLIRLPLVIVPSVLACELLETRRHFALAACALVAAGVLDASYGLVAIATGNPLYPGRFSGLMGVNFTAIVVLSAVAIAASLLSRTARRPMQLAVAVLALLGLATLSKGGVVALLAAVALVVWPLSTSGNRRLMAMFGVMVLAVVMAHGDFRERLGVRLAAEVQHDGIARTSTDVRSLILKTAWDGIGARPFIGIGFFNFQNYSLTNEEVRQSTSGIGYGTHNTYIEVLVEGGILAAACFSLHFLLVLRALPLLYVAIFKRKDVLIGAVMAGLIVALISAAVANVLLHFLFWGISGVALACVGSLRDYGRDRAMKPSPSPPEVHPPLPSGSQA